MSVCMHIYFGKFKEKNLGGIHQRDNRVYFWEEGSEQ